MIHGKLLAWREGRSHNHRSDIYDMLVSPLTAADPALAASFDEAYLDAQAIALGPEVAEFWRAIRAAARAEAGRSEG